MMEDIIAFSTGKAARNWDRGTREAHAMLEADREMFVEDYAGP